MTAVTKLQSRLNTIQNQWKNLFPRIHDPDLFKGLDQDLAVRWFSYFFSIPKKDSGSPHLRTHVLAFYDPFAKRAVFPAGIRFCCNVYVGCIHQCSYCYTQTYNAYPDRPPRRKETFRERFEKDLDELKRLELPPVPLHLSNSTDPLQEPLESEFKDTLYVLHRLAEGEKKHFSLIRILTRNPAILNQPEYLKPLQMLKDLMVVQGSLPIIDEAASRLYEPYVPSPRSRLEAIAGLCAAGIPVTLRIDPLFPRDPLPVEIFGQARLSDYGIQPVQSESDLRHLVSFAAECGCKSIIYSALKIPRGGYIKETNLLQPFHQLYRDAAKKAPARMSGNYLRLPEAYQKGELLRPLIEEAEQVGIYVEHCKHNLIHAR